LVEAGKGFDQVEAARQGIGGLGWLGHSSTVKDAVQKVEGACPGPNKSDSDDHSAGAGQVVAGGESGDGGCRCEGGYGTEDQDAVLVTRPPLSAGLLRRGLEHQCKCWRDATPTERKIEEHGDRTADGSEQQWVGPDPCHGCAEMGDFEPVAPSDVGIRDRPGVDPGVVVALGLPASLIRSADQAMDDVAVAIMEVDLEHHQITEAILGLCSRNGEVAGMERGLHAVPDHLGEGGATAYVRRCQEHAPSADEGDGDRNAGQATTRPKKAPFRGPSSDGAGHGVGHVRACACYGVMVIDVASEVPVVATAESSVNVHVSVKTPVEPVAV